MTNDNGKANSVMGAAIFGAVVGAAAVTLLNKDMRKKVKSAIVDSLEKGDVKLEEASKKMDVIRSQAAKKTAEKLDTARKKLQQTV